MVKQKNKIGVFVNKYPRMRKKSDNYVIKYSWKRKEKKNLWYFHN